MSNPEKLLKYTLLTSEMLIAPERKWAPRVLLPGEIPIPLRLLEDEQFFTTAFAQTVAQAAIKRLPKDLAAIQNLLETKQRLQINAEGMEQNGKNFNPDNLSITVENTKQGNALSYRHEKTAIKLDTRPGRQTVASIVQDHPVSREVWQEYGWEPKARTPRWHEEKIISWNAFLRLMYRNLAVAFTNEGLEKLERQGRIKLDV